MAAGDNKATEGVGGSRADIIDNTSVTEAFFVCFFRPTLTAVQYIQHGKTDI